MLTSIHQVVTFPAAPDKVFAALMDAGQHSKFTGGAPAVIDPAPGGQFSAYNGMISGRNIEVVGTERIVQAWRVGEWPAGAYSIVKMELAAVGSGTELTLDHSGFPEGAGEHLDPGWHKMYWEPLRTYLAAK